MKLVKSAVIRRWDKLLERIESLVDAFPSIIREKAPTTTKIFISNYLQTVWPFIILASLLTVTVSGVELCFYGFLSKFVNYLSATQHGDQSSYSINPFLLLIFLYSALPILNLAQSIFSYQILAENLPIRFTYIAHQLVLRRKIDFFSTESSANISAKITQTSAAIKDVSTTVLDAFLYLAVFFGGVFYAIFSKDWIFIAPMAIWMVVYFFIAKFFISRIGKASQEYANYRSRQSGVLADVYANIRTVKIFSSLAAEKVVAKNSMSKTLRKGLIQYRYITFFSTSLYAVNTLLLFAVCFLSWRSWQSGTLSVGGVAAAVALVLRVNSFSHWMMWEAANFLSNLGTIKDGFRFLIPSNIGSERDTERAVDVRRSSGISFSNIVFSYPSSKTPVLKNLTLNIEAGEKIGLVGRSGCGKSTLLSLLLRFYEAELGSVSINMKSLKKLSDTELRAKVSIASQDSMLLNRTLFENLLLQCDRPNGIKVKSVIKATGLDLVERNLYDEYGGCGMNAILNENGQNLSGGQRQRVAIARALLKDSPIIIFDEATSAMDSESESLLLDNIQGFLKDKTVISVAHRLSSLSHLDRVVVLDNGRVVEDGGHNQLMKKGGIYADFWKTQIALDDKK